MQDRVLSHIEELEYRKQQAREYAKDVLGEVDVPEALSDDSGHVVDSIIAALLILIVPIAREAAADSAAYSEELGLAPLATADIDAIVDDTTDEFIVGARQALINGLEMSLDRIRAAVDEGVSVETIQKAITSDEASDALLAPLYGALKRFSGGFIQGVERNVNDAALQEFRRPSTTDVVSQAVGAAEEPTLTWIAVVDQRTCRGEFEHACYPRHGAEMTLPDWQKKGLPGSSVLLCSMFAPTGASPCRCTLADPDRAVTIPQPVRAAAAVKAGRDRAIAEAQKRRP